MSGGQKGFTLIELLVVIAILGVIAAVVALNVSTFFGRGTVQAANTELHQVQTAIISLMADCETGTIDVSNTDGGWWAGGNATSPMAYNGTDWLYASDYVYGPFRAAYQVDSTGTILEGSAITVLNGGHFPNDRSPWSGLVWSDANKNWQAAP